MDRFENAIAYMKDKGDYPNIDKYKLQRQKTIENFFGGQFNKLAKKKEEKYKETKKNLNMK